MNERLRLMQGNEACALAAAMAGVRFFAGYPITPSTEIAEQLSEILPKLGGKFIQMEDEIASMAAIVGASLAGKKSMTATSGPGFSLKQENIGFAAFTEIPCVIVNVQRTGPSTGLPTNTAQGDMMQAKFGSHGDIPAVALYPSTVPEIFDMTIKAINISETLRQPVILLLDEIIGHMREKIQVPTQEQVDAMVENRPKPGKGLDKYQPYDSSMGDVPPLAAFGEGYRFHVTGLYHDATGFPTSKPSEVENKIKRIHRKIDSARKDITFLRYDQMDDAEYAIISCGSTARSARRAVTLAREKGIKVGSLQLKTIWPFPSEEVAEVCGRVKKVIVPEMNMGQLVLEVERAAKGSCKVVRHNRVDGDPLTPEEILDTLAKEVAW
jgi:2-oxoglutarate ferredoxin oxidoreductase subunit alpha